MGSLREGLILPPHFTPEALSGTELGSQGLMKGRPQGVGTLSTTPGNPVWLNGISSILGALGRRFDPRPSTVKDLALLQLQLRLQLQLGSDPWPRSSICLGAKKKKNHTFAIEQANDSIKMCGLNNNSHCLSCTLCVLSHLVGHDM